MTKLEISVGILATVFCFSVRAQTVNVMTLDQAGAQTVLQAARESARQRNSPSAIAVVDPAGDLLAFQRMDGVRPASAGLAIDRAFEFYSLGVLGTSRQKHRPSGPDYLTQIVI